VAPLRVMKKKLVAQRRHLHAGVVAPPMRQQRLKWPRFQNGTGDRMRADACALFQDADTFVGFELL